MSRAGISPALEISSPGEHGTSPAVGPSSIKALDIDVQKRRICLLICFLATLTQGCAGRIWNEPGPVSMLEHARSAADRQSNRADDVFVVLAFSGGGTRSAAFAYGILETMRDTKLSIKGQSRRLLDEVDVITSVSGGSYTAAYYGLFGEKIFTDFEAAFLKRNVQGELKSLLVNPIALASLTAPGLNRSDIVATWLGDNVFQNKSFADMKSWQGPSVIVNASDINTGMTFSFIQQQFDFLCSNIDDFPVARAVMASSAVPGYFAPIALRNFNRDCPARQKAWVLESLKKPDIYSRNYQIARGLERYLKPASMPVVRLVDGGITDNLGVRGSMMSPVMHSGNVDEMVGAFSPERLDTVTKVLVVVANAQTYEDYTWSREGLEPSLVGAISASFDSAIGIMNNETIGLARRGFMQWAENVNKRPARSGRKPVDVTFAALTFDHIQDDDERRHFNAIPTALSLGNDQVDEVRALSRRLLGASPEFQSFLTSLR